MNFLLACMCTTFMPGVHGGQKKAPGDWMVVNPHVDTRNQICVLWKSRTLDFSASVPCLKCLRHCHLSKTLNIDFFFFPNSPGAEE